MVMFQYIGCRDYAVAGVLTAYPQAKVLAAKIRQFATMPLADVKIETVGGTPRGRRRPLLPVAREPRRVPRRGRGSPIDGWDPRHSFGAPEYNPWVRYLEAIARRNNRTRSANGLAV